MRSYLAILTSCILATALWATPTVTQSLSPAEGHIGDDWRYQWVATVNVNEMITPVTSQNGVWGAFVVKAASLNRELIGDKTRITYDAVMTTFQLGEVYTPTPTVMWDHEGQSTLAELSPLSVRVTSVLDPNQSQDYPSFSPLLSLTIEWAPYLWMLVLILVCVGAAYLGWRWWKGQTHLDTPAPVTEPELSPKDWAVAALKALLEKGYLKQGLVREFYLGLTDVMKHYLSRLHRANVSEMTTDEVLAFMNTRTDAQTNRRLRHVLELGDLAKFAKYSPTNEEHKEAIHRVRDIIERTSP